MPCERFGSAITLAAPALLGTVLIVTGVCVAGEV